MFPYQEDSNMATMVSKMALKMHQEGNDVRVFMPRFGQISERKFQLHEVIRLSGMNIIINDLDQPLIIKVASLPGERLQVYFIDNEEYFKRKHYYADEEEKESYGLTDDATVLTITYQSGEEETTLKLTIGATTEDDAYYYVSMDDSDQVNTVSKESVDAVLDAISGYGM